jgi:hypothetical protein
MVKKIAIIIFIFFLINIGYSVKAMPQYVNDGTWVKSIDDIKIQNNKNIL